MKLRKFLCSTITLSMLLTNTAAFAEETTQSDSIWNSSYVEAGTESIYEDFPILIDKTINSEMSMDLDFVYLKNLAEDDSATMTITNNSTNEIVLSQNLSESVYSELENITEDNDYLISISENINGEEALYEKILVVEKEEEHFPINATFGNNIINNNVGEAFNCLMIKKVGDNGECNHDESEECTFECSPIKKIAPENLDSFYSELDENAFYEAQLEATYNNISTRYRGFFSTHNGGENLGIFTLDYSLINPVDYMNASAFAMNPEDELISTASIFDDAYNYNIFETLIGNSSSAQMVQFTAPETGWYTIETVGNTDTKIRLYNSLSSSDYYTYTDGGTGGNVSFRIGLAAGTTEYMRIMNESGTSGYYGFKIIYEDGEDFDELSNYVDELRTQAIAGNYSVYEMEREYIDYQGDVDMLVYNTTTGNGVLEFTTYGSNYKVTGYYADGTVGGAFDDLWQFFYDVYEMDSQNPNFTKRESAITNFNSGRTYFKIQQINENISRGYGFKVYTPNRLDDAERAVNATNGATPVTPINVDLSTGYDAFSTKLHTIHKGDEDWFKIDMTNETAEMLMTATLTKGDSENLYNLALYDEVEILGTNPQSWSTSSSIGTVNSTSTSRIIEYSLQPGIAYYLKVSGSSSLYDSMNKYGLNIEIEAPDTTPSATLSGNVVLTHTQGTNITSLDSFLNSVMANLTCMEGDTVIADSVAISDVVLYYNNSALTVATVNGLSAGSYTLTAEYKEAEATGGTITLTVSAPAADEEVVLTGTLEKISSPSSTRDWYFCARSFANYKRVAEGQTAVTYGIKSVVDALNSNDSTLGLSVTSKADINTTALAACYMYTASESFDVINNGLLFGAYVDNLTPDYVYSHLQSNSPIIILLTDEATPNNMDLARYLLIYGCNKTDSTFKIYDPMSTSIEDVSWSLIFNGGYSTDNPDLKYSGSIIFDPYF